VGKLLTILILLFIASCDHQHWYSCTFDHTPGQYTLTDRDLEKKDAIIFVHKGEREFALKREYLIACVGIGKVDTAPEKE